MRGPVVLALVALLALSACGGVRPAGDETVARVGDEPITRDTVEVLLASRVAAEGGMSGQPDPAEATRIEQLQRQTLSELIQDRIVAVAAQSVGVSVSDEQIEQRFTELAEQYGGIEQLRQEIENRGRTEADVREQLASVIRSELLAAYFAQQAGVSPEEVREEYERRREAGDMRVADVSHILVPDREQAEEVLDQLEAGTDFAELAEQYSTDEFSAAGGGNLGESRRGRFVEPFDDAVWSASSGDIVGPVETEFGFHVIWVREIREIPFEEVADEIRQELGGQRSQGAFDEWYQDALRDTDVWIQPRLGEWDPETGRVVAGTSLDASPPPPPGSTEAPAPGQAPDQAPDQAPGQAPGQAPDQAPGQAPAPGDAPASPTAVPSPTG